MLIGLYNAASGMIVQREKEDVTARNLANVNVIGYKKEAVKTHSFTKILTQEVDGVESPHQSMTYMTNEPVTVFEQGELKETGNTLDLALNGDGFFHLKTPYGDMYTRDGRLKLNKEGELVTRTHGYNVLDPSGQTIRIVGSDVGDVSAYMQKISIAEDGTISLMPSDVSGNTQIGQLRLVKFEDPSELENIGYGLVKEPEKGIAKHIDNETSVHQGYLERSNINIVDQMKDMILNIRAFEANQKIIKEIDKTLSSAIQGLTR